MCRVEFDTFNILEDNDVWQGLKKYSNWPTYPQLYVKGELIGGLDIARVRVKSLFDVSEAKGNWKLPARSLLCIIWNKIWLG